MHNENGLTNAISKLRMDPSTGDRLILADTNGWTWLGPQQIPKSAGAGDLGTTTNRWKEVHIQKANVDTFNILNNTITPNASDGNINFVSTGSGKVKVDDLSNPNIVASETGDLVLNPINACGSFRYKRSRIPPPGETAPRSLHWEGGGGIRYNTNINAFEGTSHNRIVSLQGIYDS